MKLEDVQGVSFETHAYEGLDNLWYSIPVGLFVLAVITVIVAAIISSKVDYKFSSKVATTSLGLAIAGLVGCVALGFSEESVIEDKLVQDLNEAGFSHVKLDDQEDNFTGSFDEKYVSCSLVESKKEYIYHAVCTTG